MHDLFVSEEERQKSLSLLSFHLSSIAFTSKSKDSRVLCTIYENFHTFRIIGKPKKIVRKSDYVIVQGRLQYTKRLQQSYHNRSTIIKTQWAIRENRQCFLPTSSSPQNSCVIWPQSHAMKWTRTHTKCVSE